MKFIVEVEEFWLESEEIEKELKETIIRSVVASIHKSLDKKIEDTITRAVKSIIEKSMLQKTNIVIDEFIKNGTMKGDYSSDPPLTVAAYIKNKFDNKNGWGNPKEQIEKLAKQLGEELKSRYDLVFATQIVKAIDAQGLLKENVAKLLL